MSITGRPGALLLRGRPFVDRWGAGPVRRRGRPPAARGSRGAHANTIAPARLIVLGARQLRACGPNGGTEAAQMSRLRHK